MANREGVTVREQRSFYRYMSRAELRAVEETGMLRGRLPGRTYWTTDLYTTTRQAKSHLALSTLPEVRVEFRITNEPVLRRAADTVEPSMGEPGGGSEYMTTEKVSVEVIRIDNLD